MSRKNIYCYNLKVTPLTKSAPRLQRLAHKICRRGKELDFENLKRGARFNDSKCSRAPRELSYSVFE